MLFKGPERKDTLSIDLTFTSSARRAWSEILRRQSAFHDRKLNLLIPAYVGQTDREGSGVFDPVRAAGADFDFYSLDNRLIPDQTEIEQKISSGNFDVLLVMHYFGFVHTDLTSLAELCSKHDVILVEDCAHCCYLPRSEYGWRGDYSFYSIHKFFPTETGGILRVNRHSDESATLPVEAQCDPAVLEQVMRTDIPGVIEKRRRNYLFLEKSLQGVQGVVPLWKLDAQTIPHNFPVYVESNRREKLYFHLMDRDLATTALYYRLIDELDEDTYPTSFDVANGILNLPVHQDTEEDDLVALVTEIEKFLES